ETELQVSRIERAASLSKVQAIYAIVGTRTQEVCSRKLEIGVVKHIECLCPKLKAHSLRKVEIFKNRHVRTPECRPYNWRPMGAALERPDPVELPAAECSF